MRLVKMFIGILFLTSMVLPGVCIYVPAGDDAKLQWWGGFWCWVFSFVHFPSVLLGIANFFFIYGVFKAVSLPV